MPRGESRVRPQGSLPPSYFYTKRRPKGRKKLFLETVLLLSQGLDVRPPFWRSGSATDACHLNYLAVLQIDGDVIETCIVKLLRQNWTPRYVERTDNFEHQNYPEATCWRIFPSQSTSIPMEFWIFRYCSLFLPLTYRLLGEGMKHDSALRALMGESKAQQKQRLQERLEKLRKLKKEGGEVNEQEMSALEQVETEGIDAVDAEVLNHLIEETVTDTEEVTTNTLLNDLQVMIIVLPSPPFILSYCTFCPSCHDCLVHFINIAHDASCSLFNLTLAKKLLVIDKIIIFVSNSMSPQA